MSRVRTHAAQLAIENFIVFYLHENVNNLLLFFKVYLNDLKCLVI